MPNNEYNNFKELEKNEVGNYAIECVDRGSKVTIIAPHGGRIEPRTNTIAKAIACQNFNYYVFIAERGKIQGRKNMHITSHHFDEPKALELVGKSKIVIAIHGCSDSHAKSRDKKEIFIGGLDEGLIDEVREVLEKASLPVSFFKKFPGTDPDNICNRGSTGNGVQFELTDSFRKDKGKSENFIMIVRACLEKLEEKLS